MLYPFRFDKQFEKYIYQFMRVFSGFQTQDGVERDGSMNLKRVPVVYGNMSRVVSSVLNKRDSFNSNRIPLMAVNMRSLRPDAERKRASMHHDRVTVNKNNSKVGLERLIGPALVMNMDVSIYASSTTELFSILEQILLIFNPRVTIQTDNSLYNSDYITEITLEDISPDIQYPMGENKQVVMLDLSFSVPVRLRYPVGTDGAVVHQIIVNILEDSANNIEPINLEQIVIGELPIEETP